MKLPKVFVEYVVLAGVNDSLDEAKELGELLQYEAKHHDRHPQTQPRMSDTLAHHNAFIRCAFHSILFCICLLNVSESPTLRMLQSITTSFFRHSHARETGPGCDPEPHTLESGVQPSEQSVWL
eukprot:scaffold104621_cov32-Prasinocladus_malaysianus.AAC.1